MKIPIFSTLKRRSVFSYTNVFLFFMISAFILLVYQFEPHRPNLNDVNRLMYYTNSTEYIIYNEKCRLPNVDPFNPEVKDFFEKFPYVPCTEKSLLTYVTKNEENTEATLSINETAVPLYATNITCCYSNVTRNELKPGSTPDNILRISKCTDFETNLTLSNNAVIVRCRNYKGQEVYSNVHVAIIINKIIKEKIAKFKNSGHRPLSLLYIAIDSISRLSMYRALPITRHFLRSNNWSELMAYNKMGTNTFPNLMATLTGRNQSSAFKACDPFIEGGLNNNNKCNILWYDYQKQGYITAYGEDESNISSFNYLKLGFFEEPVDYYFRAYTKAADTLKQLVVDGMTFCAGPESSGERIMNLAKDFAVTFKNVPSFGLFWMNSFSHDALNAPTRMDEKIKQFFESLTNEGILENTVVVFLSDHGLRFGKIVETYSGWMEERLPMFNMWVPKWFIKEFPNEYKNLRNNKNKLTAPFDVYMTLQDILLYSGTNHKIVPSQGCPTCRSLFKEIDPVRSCDDASIPVSWCACGGFDKVDEKDSTVQKAAQFILSNIQTKISEYSEGTKCFEYSLKKVISARTTRFDDNWYKEGVSYVVVFETVPTAVFEATVKMTTLTLLSSISFTLENGISRLDKYKANSQCVSDYYLRTLCYCLETDYIINGEEQT